MKVVVFTAALALAGGAAVACPGAAKNVASNPGIEKTAGYGGGGEVAGSCSWSAGKEVQNVANKDASSCGYGAKEVKNVAYGKDASSCAASCGSKAAKTVATAAVEKTDGLGGAADGTDSGFIGLGDKVYNFSALHAQSGEMKSLKDVAGDKATVLIFWNQNCPYCVGPSGSWERIAQTAKSWEGKGVNIVLIDPGADKSPDAIKNWAKSSNVPVLINQDSSIAAKFNATYTPEAFVLNSDHELVYRGAWDVKRDGSVRTYASDAVLDVLNGQEITVNNARGFGCSIKWAEGAKPKS